MVYILLFIGGAVGLNLGFAIALGRASACADAWREVAFAVHMHRIGIEAELSHHIRSASSSFVGVELPTSNVEADCIRVE